MLDPETDPDDKRKVSLPQQFTETRWSKVVLASQGDRPQSRQALEELCQRYWHPIYAFLRREGASPEDAEDLTQQFFGAFLRKNALAMADPSKGRFRSFLLRSLRNFRIDQERKRSAQKRGGRRVVVATDMEEAEERYEQYPDPALTPEKIYDRQWVTTLLDQALIRLQAEFAGAGQARRFDTLKKFLSHEVVPGEYDELTGSLGMAKGAIAKAVFRMRQRYAQLIRMEIRETVADPDEVEREFVELFG